jgi:Ca2+-binding RTX toxin-like protein
MCSVGWSQGGFVTATYSPASNLLTIHGTNRADMISVTASQTHVKVTSWDWVLSREWVLAAPGPKVICHMYDGNDSFQIVIEGIPTAIQPKDNEIYGGPGSDFIFGSDNVDWIDGGPDNDLVWARGGDDVIVGGPGADTIWSGTGADYSTGSGGWFYDDGEANTLDQGGAQDIAALFFVTIENPTP